MIAVSALAYAALVAHLLFIPYALSPLPFGEALRRFTQIRWFHLGPDQNVALVSRGLMWLPLGTLLAAAIATHRRSRIELPGLVFGVLLGSGWAIAVNFAQLWFPERSFSLNNLVAEICGVAAGALVWSVPGTNGLRWWRRLTSGGLSSLEAALDGYVILYLVSSLTPFDFVTSAADLATKLDSNLYGLWLAPIGCGPAPCVAKFLAVVFASIPCGWWVASWRPWERHAWLTALLLALIASTCIELLHLMMVSGVSQGASVAARTAGTLLGSVTYSGRCLARLDLNRVGRPAVLALLAPYLFLVFYVAGWFRADPLGFRVAIARWDHIAWLPFYYVYYNPYASTMLSALTHFSLYAPIGVMCWLWVRDRTRIPVWLAAPFAAPLCFVAETSKIFLSDRMPDYSDVYIAIVAATLTLAVLRLVSRSSLDQVAVSQTGARVRAP
jgi:VanZ family protein